MTNSKRKPEADDEVRKAIARARKFLADKGIDCAAPIHREDAARFMVEFAILEKEFSEEMRLARKVMQDRHDALRKLADS
jgi:stage V sporulation protein SpoVS